MKGRGSIKTGSRASAQADRVRGEKTKTGASLGSAGLQRFDFEKAPPRGAWDRLKR